MADFKNTHFFHVYSVQTVNILIQNKLHTDNKGVNMCCIFLSQYFFFQSFSRPY